MTLQVVNQDLTKLQAEALVVLFEIDASAPEIGGEIMYLCNQLDSGSVPIVWQGQVYNPYPIYISDVEVEGKGMSNRPRLSLGNVNGLFSAMNILLQDLLGAKVTRRRVLAKYLDGHASANTSAGLPEDVFFIDMKVGENRNVVSYELAGVYDLDGIRLPIPRVNSNSCVVLYRSAECGYAGIPVTDKDGAALTPLVDRGVYSEAASYGVGDYFYKMYQDIRLYFVCISAAGPGTSLSNTAYFKMDTCTKRLVSGCQAHFGTEVALPFLAFPGTELLPNG